MPLSALSLPDADRRKVVDALIKSSSGAAFSPNELASSASIRSSTSRFSHMWRPMSLCVFPYVSGLILFYTALATSASWCARSSSPWAVHPYSSSMASTSGPWAAGPLQYSTSSSHSSSVCTRFPKPTGGYGRHASRSRSTSTLATASSGPTTTGRRRSSVARGWARGLLMECSLSPM